MPDDVVFVSSGFRTGSTWFWSKLREHPELCCYYEPFNEMIAELTPARLLVSRPTDWRSHHPDGAAYTLEYGELLGDTPGIPGFTAEAFRGERFVGREGVNGRLDPDVQDYVSSLIEAARERDRVPVLACTRLLGRSYGLKQAFGGYHILLIRNLFQQWNSFAGQLRFDNPYFFEFLHNTITLSDRDDYVKYLANYFPDDRKDTFENWKREDNFDRVFCYFVGFHVYFLLHARRHADLTVDINALVRSGDTYRRGIERAIKLNVGVPIDLAGATENVDYPAYLIKSPTECAAIIHDMVEKAFELSDASPAERAFTETLLQDMWKEHADFSRCTSGVEDLIAISERRIADVLKEGEATRAAVDVETQKSQRLSARIDELEESIAQARSREAELETSLAVSRQQHSEAAAELDRARGAIEREAQRARDLSMQVGELGQRLNHDGAQAKAREIEMDAALSASREQLAEAAAKHARQEAGFGSTLSQLGDSLQQHRAEAAQVWSRLDKLEADHAETERRLLPRLTVLVGRLLDQPLSWRLLPAGQRRQRFLAWLSSNDAGLDNQADNPGDEHLGTVTLAALNEPPHA